MALPLDHAHPRFADRDAETEGLFATLAATSDDVSAAPIVERITVLYLDLCSSMARRYAGRGVEAEDLEQVARLALVTALRRYRLGRGPSFAAYAVPTISGELKRSTSVTGAGWYVRRAGCRSCEPTWRPSGNGLSSSWVIRPAAPNWRRPRPSALVWSGR